MKANELDIVELTEDVQDFPRGTHGTIIVAFTQQSEAYDIEVVARDGSGQLIYGVRPEKFKIDTRLEEMR